VERDCEVGLWNGQASRGKTFPLHSAISLLTIGQEKSLKSMEGLEMNIISAFTLLALLSGSVVGAQQKSGNEGIHAACPMMHQSDSDLNHRGEQGMGFSQTATNHHFLLKSDGGVIQVEVNDPSDADQLADVRMHLHHIAAAFQQGDFNIPMFVHDTTPPGEPEMKALHGQIHYLLEETKTGGRVVISSTNKDAVEAVHQFLIFQIQEHKTGDPLQVP
jgi:hypothetical protein